MTSFCDYYLHVLLYVDCRRGKMKDSKRKVSKVSVTVYITVIVFSMSTWMDVVGVWTEMPLFVTALPEAWSLPSYLAMIIQMSNIGPAVYAVVQKFQQGKRKTASDEDRRSVRRLDAEVVLTLVIITTSAVNVFLLSFLWPITGFIGGRRHSVVMLTQMVPAALTSCMTSLVFLPYMARFPSSYISAHYVGQGFSGLVPSLIGLVQGAGSPPYCVWNSTQVMNNSAQNVTDQMTLGGMINTTTTSVIIQSQEPLFSVQVFFFCLAVLFLVSLAAFCCLNFTKCGRSAMISHVSVAYNLPDESQQCTGEPAADGIHRTSSIADVDLPEHNIHQMSNFVRADNKTTESTEVQNDQMKDEELLEKLDKGTDTSETCKKTSVEMQNRVFIWLLIVIGIVNALSNGLLPSTESYTCLPYGYLIYTLAVRLSAVAASLAALSSMFLPRASVKVVFALTLLGLIIATFHMFLAAQSPNPVLRGYLLGDIIVVSEIQIIISVSFRVIVLFFRLV